MGSRGLLGSSFIAAAIAAGALAAPAAQADPLRVCADPDNLPFSKSEGPERGLYIELAELVAKRLGSPIEYTWWLTHNQRRATRNTILQGNCDAVFALPAEGEYKARGLQRTQPFLELGYAIVAPPSFAFAGLGDLKGKRVSVQIQTPPHIFLSGQEGVTISSWRSADEALDALARGEVDLAIVWGPVGGYENSRRFNSRWRVTPVSGQGMVGHVAVAVRKGKDALAADIEKALSDLEGEIAKLADKYGFPRGKPVELERRSSLSDTAPRVADVPAGAWVAAADRKPAARTKPAEEQPPYAAPAVAEARVRFNDQCSHCHGKDGFSPVQERDLRRLKLRYDDKWPETAKATIKGGRQDKGMPSWKDALDEQQIEGLVGFLKAIQK